MKILYHHRTRCTGADGTHIQGVVKGFQDIGHSVRVTSVLKYGVNHKREKSKTIEGGVKNKSIFVKAPRYLFELLELLYNIPAVVKLFWHQITGRYDVIYERYAFLNITGFMISLLTSTPLFLEANFTTKTPVRPERTRVFSFLERWMECIVFKHATVIIVISETLKNMVAGQGIAKEKILVLANAVNIAKFKPKEAPEELRVRYRLNKTDRVVGFVGSFYPWHGLDFLLDSFKLVVLECGNAKLMLIGDGQLSESIRQRVAKEHLEDKVIFTGHIGNEYLADYLAIFDVGIMPDSNEYGSPMKIFEYMAMEKPVVAPCLEPIEAVVTHGQEGLLFTRQNMDELKKVLLQLLMNNGLREKIGRNGRHKVINEHTWVKNVEKILKLYERLKNKN